MKSGLLYIFPPLTKSQKVQRLMLETNSNGESNRFLQLQAPSFTGKTIFSNLQLHQQTGDMQCQSNGMFV